MGNGKFKEDWECTLPGILLTCTATSGNVHIYHLYTVLIYGNMNPGKSSGQFVQTAKVHAPHISLSSLFTQHVTVNFKGGSWAMHALITRG